MSSKTALLKPEIVDATQKLREEVQVLRDKKNNLARFSVLPEQRGTHRAHLRETQRKLRYKEKCLKASERYDPYTPSERLVAGMISVPPRFSLTHIRIRLLGYFVATVCNAFFAFSTNSQLYFGLSVAVAFVCFLITIVSCVELRSIIHPALEKSGTRAWKYLDYVTLFEPRIYKQLLPSRIMKLFASAKTLRVFDEILVFSPSDAVFEKIINEDMEVTLVGRVDGGSNESFFRIGSWRLKEEELKHIV